MTPVLHTAHTAAANRRRTNGFSLLEALVTTVVVSVGLLGILGMQTAGMTYTRIAASRSNAAVAADNFTARMRANPAVSYGDVRSYADPSQVANVPDCSLQTGHSCSADQIKQVDLWQWSKTLQRTLPNGQGEVDCMDSACERYRITIAWDEHEPAGHGGGTNTTSASSGSGNTQDLCDDAPHENSITRCFRTEVRL